MSKNPLTNLPFNTKKAYVRGITPDGCQVFVPVDSQDDDVLQLMKADVQAYLDTSSGPKLDPETPKPTPEAA